MSQSSTKLLTLLLTLSTCLVFILASPAANPLKHRSDKLFQKYPLHSTIVSKTAENTRLGSNIDEYLNAAKSAMSHIEQSHLRSLADSLKSPQTASPALAKSTKPQWFGYYQNAPVSTLFHNYASSSVIIYGTADAQQLTMHMSQENYWPIILGRSSRAIVALHISRNEDTTLGAFDELLLTTHATKKTEELLGVTYEEGNDASLLYPLFGKLPDHHRQFVLKAITSNSASQRYIREIHGFPATASRQIASSIESGVVDASSPHTQTQFSFTDAKTGKNIISGRIPEDRSWRSWAQTAYKIYRALGLSGIFDLWFAKHVPLKFASPVNAGAKVSDHYANFKGLSIQELKEGEFELNYDTESTDLGRLLQQIDFQPRMVARLPFFQYAMGAPKEQIEDMDYLTSELRFSKRVRTSDGAEL